MVEIDWATSVTVPVLTMATSEMLHKRQHSSDPVTGGRQMRSPRARALGKALREARQATGRKLRDFALEIGRDPGVLSRWETGERTPNAEHLAQILTKLGITGKQFDEMIALAKGIDQPRWLAVTLPEQRQQFAALLDLEESATRIIDVEPLMVPGLLQTNAYIRAIMTGGSVPSV